MKSALKTHLFTSGKYKFYAQSTRAVISGRFSSGLITLPVCVKLCATGFVRVCPDTFHITGSVVFM